MPTLLRGMEPDVTELDLRRSPVVRAVERSRDAVVSIYITRGAEDLQHGVDGQGSGVIIDAGGLVITNWHVIAASVPGRNAIVVRLRDGNSYPADLLSSSPENDLALLQLRTTDRVSAIETGDSDGLMVGETVIAIGNPQGLSNSVTVGVLSSVERSITVRAPDGAVRSYRGLLQTDAAINQGNSGGALLDITGRLIGINNAMAFGVENIGYAIPVNTVRKVFEEVLVSSENLASVWLGLRVDARDGKAIVTELTKAGPAARAGMRIGDVIEHAGDREVHSPLDYARSTIGAKTGQPFPIRVTRAGENLTLSVQPMSRTQWEILRRTGIELERVTVQQDRALVETASRELYSGSRQRRIPLLPSVLKVTTVADDSAASELGVRDGDVILAASVPTMFGRWTYRPMRTLDEFAEVLRERAGNGMNMLLLRDGQALEGALQIR